MLLGWLEILTLSLKAQFAFPPLGSFLEPPFSCPSTEVIIAQPSRFLVSKWLLKSEAST